MEDEKEKRSERITDEEDQKEWKRVVGGFVPRFLRREGADVRTSPVEMVDTLEDYKRVVVDEPDRIVVVRFFAPWCKSCKAAHPIFKKMVSEHSETSVKFVEVPLTKETAYIHEGLGVPSVPFGHIYHPEAGLVEEKKINKRVFKEFREALDSYVRGSCDLPLEDGQEEAGITQDGFL
jgi:thiol-disulfide isomerase/thioredoxin